MLNNGREGVLIGRQSDGNVTANGAAESLVQPFKISRVPRAEGQVQIVAQYSFIPVTEAQAGATKVLFPPEAIRDCERVQTATFGGLS